MTLLTVQQVSERLLMSVAWVYARVADGSMPHYKIGGAVRVSEEQLVAYLASKEKRRAPSPARVPVKLR